MILKIIQADISQIPLIRQIAEDVWPGTYVPIVGEEQVQYMLERFYSRSALKEQMEEHDHRFLMAYDEQEAVGFASYSLLAEGVYKLHKLYVLDGRHGKGIGRALMSQVVSELAERSATALHVNVNRYNTNAITFYTRFGFRHVRTEDIDIGSGYYMNDYVLGLDIG